jgi:hypothetical protein
MPRLLVVLDTRSLECGCGFVEGEQMLFCPDHREGYPMTVKADESIYNRCISEPIISNELGALLSPRSITVPVITTGDHELQALFAVMHILEQEFAVLTKAEKARIAGYISERYPCHSK